MEKESFCNIVSFLYSIFCILIWFFYRVFDIKHETITRMSTRRSTYPTNREHIVVDKLLTIGSPKWA